MKKVAIIGTVGVPSKYGGFETLADNLVSNLSNEFKFSVYCSKKSYKKKERIKSYKGARLYYLPFNANGVQSIIYDIVSMIHALFYADTLIVLGVSGGVFIPFIKLFTRKKVIVNIDGLEWRRAKWGKRTKKFLKFSERVAVKWSHADITDNYAIKRYTSINYKSLSQLIEYGADHTIKVPISKNSREEMPFLNGTYAFKVARIEPENNIEMVLKAFVKSSYMLVIVGNWDASDYGRRLKETFQCESNIYILDPIYDQHRLDELRSNCFIYMHGHSAGGTNPSLVEAMYLGLSIFAFDCPYNRATMEKTGVFFKDAVHLREIVKSIPMNEIIQMGEDMKEIADRRYTWSVIATKYANLINAFDYNYVKRKVDSHWVRVSPKDLIANEMAHLKRPINYFED